MQIGIIEWKQLLLLLFSTHLPKDRVCPTVGVGGHFSRGGYGMMSQKFGIAADNIIDAKLIDGNGKIQDRESMGEDLFWAIRGGGGTTFGLIVSCKVKLLDIPKKVTLFNVERTLEQNAT
ncbi:hypothetical protein CQW23_34666 [Capsicum baccatum]|uniref:FAD linked oxidase N-terminal domain-containing protein n=1 Tax=Capsicum baccatum TaxID=33114 RepID=A0A2G2UY88_CAPBA|nr:hypothetical protein CQW23_34666 [Capsicum baccatum]